MNTSEQGTERVNDDGAVEISVETVDYRTPPGLDKEPIPEKVEVTHVIHADDHSAGTAGVVAEAAVKVAEKIQSVKEAVTGGDKKTE